MFYFLHDFTRKLLLPTDLQHAIFLIVSVFISFMAVIPKYFYKNLPNLQILYPFYIHSHIHRLIVHQRPKIHLRLSYPFVPQWRIVIKDIQNKFLSFNKITEPLIINNIVQLPVIITRTRSLNRTRIKIKIGQLIIDKGNLLILKPMCFFNRNH